MAIALAQGASNTGAATPATPSSLTTAAGNLLILACFVNGTSPTITPPGGWTVVQQTAGTSTTFAVFMLANNPGGATNPSMALGGTVTGWACGMWEFSGQGSNANYEQLLGSDTNPVTNGITSLPNIFLPQSNQNMPDNNLLWIYAQGRATATFTPAFSGVTWSASQNPVNANGVQLDFYWGTNPGPGAWPVAAGTLSFAVNCRIVAAWFSSALASPLVPANIGGNAGYLVGSFYQGMIGG